MTTYFVTGATGFLGRRLMATLLDRPDCETLYVLVRPGSHDKLTALVEGWPRRHAVIGIRGDLAEPGLGIDPAALPATVDHVVHLAAVYDFTASAETNRVANVDGTRHVVELAERLDAGCLHHVSSVAVAGDHAGRFTERDFDLGQHLPSPYHATKFEAEKVVRQNRTVPWRVYRPAAVVGDSRTGEMDKIDGPYYFLPMIARLSALPARLPLVAPDLGATNLVPVDYVVAAMDHLIHADAPSGATYHLVSPTGQPLTDVYDGFAKAAGGPRIRFTAPAWTARPLRRLGALAASTVDRVTGGSAVRDAVLTELGIPPTVLPHLAMPTTFGTDDTREALAGSGIEVPDFAGYADVLWRYWAEHLDPDRARRSDRRRPLAGRVIMITGASSGIGRATAMEVADRGAIPLLVARRPDELDSVRAEIEAAGGTAHTYPCDLTDAEAVDALVKQVLADHDAVDMLVNNAGRSIRRSVHLSVDRMHDFERTMTLNYFAPLRLILGLLPHMRARGFGHIVNITTMGLETDTPRFAAYLGSKAALDEFGTVAGRELLGDGVSFTSVRMPLVRTPMISPTRAYQALPAASPKDAALLVVKALQRRPVRVSRPEGRAVELIGMIAPDTARLVAHLVYAVMPESAPEVGRAPRRPPLAAGAGALTRLLWRAAANRRS
ncbi:MAG TPA: SDR family oxidoreductase [Pseudonocardiaceae bacterium]|nr:SDR family oxidoreductase [Pseudonocardiaceae bacterium]